MTNGDCAARIDALEAATRGLMDEMRNHMRREEAIMEGQATNLAFKLRELQRVDNTEMIKLGAELRYMADSMAGQLSSNAKNIRMIIAFLVAGTLGSIAIHTYLLLT